MHTVNSQPGYLTLTLITLRNTEALCKCRAPGAGLGLSLSVR